VPKSQLIFDYPLDVESRLMGFARAGNTDEVRRILHQIWDSNEIDRSPESTIAHNLVAAIFATIFRLVDERNEFGVVLSEIPSPQDQVDRDVHELFNTLSEILEKICGISQSSKRSHNQELIERILAYLEEHYLDPNLSIASLTSVFNLSETYFSSFFREQTGILFSRYLEEKRVAHGRELLQTRSGATIDAIARSSGYATTRTFRRAFKRVTGVTPSQY
jgi:AraC-like DNA-binding protein